MSVTASKTPVDIIGSAGAAAACATGTTSGQAALASGLDAVVRGRVVVPGGVTVAPVLRFYGSTDGVEFYQDGGDVAVPTAAGTYGYRYDPAPADKAVKVEVVNGDAAALAALFQAGTLASVG